MKRIIALLLVLTLAIGLVACSVPKKEETDIKETTADTNKEENNADVNTDTDADTDTDANNDVVITTDETAVTVLSTIWDYMEEDKKFFAMGGDMSNPVDNAPGAYSLEDEGITSTLLIPQEQIANVSEAASLVHAMNLNNFTCGAFKVTGDINEFVGAMYTAVSTNRWMCGQPEKMAIAVIGEYVIVVFGLNDAVEPFLTAMTTVYPRAELDYEEAITG